MSEFLRFDPQKRPTCAQALQHPYFQVGVGVSMPLKSLITMDKPATKRFGSPDKKKKKQQPFKEEVFPLVKKESQNKLLKQARYVPGIRNKGMLPFVYSPY